LTLLSCQDTIPQRSTITAGSNVEDKFKCSANQTLTEISNDSTSSGPIEFTDPSTGKNYYCKTNPVTRPDGAVFWKSDFCICKDGSPISYGNCQSFCSGRSTKGAETLFANFRVGDEISLGALGNVEQWCNRPIDGDTENPTCKIEAKDDSGTLQTFNVTATKNSNSLTADLQNLLFDKTYVLTLVQSSGKRSDSIQMIKFSTDISLGILGTLKNGPISQYSCLARDYSTVDSDLFYEKAYRLHFYFTPRLPPKPISADIINLVCHDFLNPLYGRADDELYPRMELIPGIFNLWDVTDPRFYDNNGNKELDINEAIIAKTKHYGGSIPAGTKFFSEFKADNSDKYLNPNQKTYVPPVLGHFMAPWIDQTTFKSYCLNSTHYKSSNPLFRAIGDFVGVDTEGIYIGFKSAESTLDAQGNLVSGSEDMLFIRETDLKAVWFYLRNGVPTLPTDENVNNVAVYFYYPLNKSSPFVKSSTQRIYRVMGQNDISSSNNSSDPTTPSGAPTSYPPHDRKIGCIPKF
jgi:hypothetical protein